MAALQIETLLVIGRAKTCASACPTLQGGCKTKNALNFFFYSNTSTLLNKRNGNAETGNVHRGSDSAIGCPKGYQVGQRPNIATYPLPVQRVPLLQQEPTWNLTLVGDGLAAWGERRLSFSQLSLQASGRSQLRPWLPGGGAWSHLASEGAGPSSR